MLNNESLFVDEITLFADVILPIPVKRLFTYRVSRIQSENIKNGARVIIPFGKNRVLTGVVAKIHQSPPKEYNYFNGFRTIICVVLGR